MTFKNPTSTKADFPSTVLGVHDPSQATQPVPELGLDLPVLCWYWG